jgi:uncharacterized protein YbaR (Trm112 family)
MATWMREYDGPNFFYNAIMMLKQLLDVLVCPVPECRKPLNLAADQSFLQCTACRRIYPIRDGIPVLLVDQAKLPGSPT